MSPYEHEKRINELVAELAELKSDHLSITRLLSDAGIEHSGFAQQAPRVEMLIDRLRTSQQNVIRFAKERNDLRRRVAELESNHETR